MYIHLIQFIVELKDIFNKNQFIKIFLFKFDEQLLELAILRIISNYNDKKMLV